MIESLKLKEKSSFALVFLVVFSLEWISRVTEIICNLIKGNRSNVFSMKEDVLEVLLFIFEHFSNDDSGYTEQDDDLVSTLVQCGFGKGEVNKALQWLDDLVDLREQDYSPDADKTTAIRFYTSYEQEKLNTDCRGFILFMEQMGVLDTHAREMVIDRAIALEGEEVDLDRLKWVVMMVLYNMPDKEGEFVWIENLDIEYQLH